MSTEVDDFIRATYLKSVRTNINWYEQYITQVLEDSEKKCARDVDKQLRLADKFHKAYNEKCALPEIVPPKPCPQIPTCDIMKPVEPEVTDIHMKASEKGGTDDYLKVRYKKYPRDRFYFRECTSWDYGWFDDNSGLNSNLYGRSQIIKASFYRTNNSGPDARHYRKPIEDPAKCGDLEC